MRLAIGLLTCGREDYTARTLESFMRMNPSSSSLVLLHADDGSGSPANLQGAWLAGFETVSQGERIGQLRQLRHLMMAARDAACSHFMLLENDWLSVRSLEELPTVPDSVDCVRLYGAWKDEGQKRAAGRHLIGTDDAIGWVPHGDGWEVAKAHWGGPPSIVKLERLWGLAMSAVSFKGISMGSRHFVTMRPTVNFVFHIGDETTPGFVP